MIWLLFSVGIILTALYYEHALGHAPCHLCWLQRVAVMGIGGTAMLGWIIHRNHYVLWTKALHICFSISGAAVAAYQLYMQSSWYQGSTVCGPTVDYILNSYPFFEAIVEILKGAGDCGDGGLFVLGLSLAAWSFVFFILSAVAMIWRVEED